METIKGRENEMEEKKVNNQEDRVTTVDIEGDPFNGYCYVCEECHGPVSWHEPVCPHCGGRLEWNG